MVLAAILCLEFVCSHARFTVALPDSIKKQASLACPAVSSVVRIGHCLSQHRLVFVVMRILQVTAFVDVSDAGGVGIEDWEDAGQPWAH
jgi:hypothetical protein